MWGSHLKRSKHKNKFRINTDKLERFSSINSQLCSESLLLLSMGDSGQSGRTNSSSNLGWYCSKLNTTARMTLQCVPTARILQVLLSIAVKIHCKVIRDIASSHNVIFKLELQLERIKIIYPSTSSSG